MKARNSMKTRRGYRCIGHLGLGDSAVAVAASSLGAESSSTDPGLEVAAASATPSSGDQIPACPDEATLGKIKDADVPVGPCMPFVDATTQAEKDQALESLGDYRHPGVCRRRCRSPIAMEATQPPSTRGSRPTCRGNRSGVASALTWKSTHRRYARDGNDSPE